MLDIGWQELFIIAILAIIVVGPKDLPRALKTVMQYVKKARGLAREFQNGVDEMVREADLDDLKKDLVKIGDSKGLENTIRETVDPTGDLSKEMDLTSAQLELEKTAKDAVKETEPETAGKSGADKPESVSAQPDTDTKTDTNADAADDASKSTAATTTSTTNS